MYPTLPIKRLRVHVHFMVACMATVTRIVVNFYGQKIPCSTCKC